MFYQIKDNLCNLSLITVILLLLAGTSSAQIDMFPRSVNGALNALGFTGADIGAQLAAAYAALPSTGGRIRVPNNASCYNMSTAFSATTAGKPVVIEGDPGTPSCINWIPTSGTAFTFDTRLNSNQHPVGMGMRDLVLTTSGAASSTAVLLAATNSAEGYTLMHVKIENFITGVSMTTSSGLTGTFAVAFLNDVFRNMTTCIVATGSGSAEMTKFIGGSFFNCGTAISSTASLSADFTVIGTSCDDPGSGGCVGNSVIVNWYGGHFENPGGGLPNYVNSNGIVNIYGGVALDDCIGLNNPVTGCTATTSSPWFSYTGTDSLVIDGTEVFTGGRTLSGTTLISLGGSGHGTFRLYNKSAFSLLTTNNFVFSQAQDLSYTTSGAQTARFQSWSVPESANVPSSVSQFDVCYGDATAHAVKCNWNNTTPAASTFANVPLVIATGTAAMPTSSVAAVSGTTITCVAASGNPFSAPNVATTDTITFVPNASPSNPNGGLIIQAWPTAAGVNFEYCNPTASALTPVAETLNWKVFR